MSFLYVDASAILTWLLREPQAEAVASILEGASGICSSELTLVECDRALLRLASEDLLTEAEREQLGARVASAAASWTQIAITPSILRRARLSFGSIPIRTLDAIHLASALEGSGALSGLALLSLDDRMRRTARAAGFDVVPT